MQASLMGCREKLPRAIVTASQDLVACAFPAGAHGGLFPFGGPGITQRAPRGTAGFIAKEQESFALPSGAEHPRPLRVTPLQTLGLIKMLRDKACLRIGQAHSVEPGR